MKFSIPTSKPWVFGASVSSKTTSAKLGLAALATLTVVCGVGLGYLFLTAQSTQAERLESDSFVIQFGNFNTGGGLRTSSSYNLTDTTGQTAAGAFTGLTQILGSGFQYIYTIDTFNFSISKLNIDLGSLAIGAHSTDSLVLTINTKGAGGYTVYAYELHPLRLADGLTTIADTTCDAGDCLFSIAKLWTNQSIPGFGFNAAGNSVSSDFISSSYFRPFADQSLSQAMQPVMQASDIATQEQATITYKAGILATQAAGEYQTGVVFVAVPGY
ncbi:MAG TPA: hypothetical protein DEP87_03745 [Candidatus Pacebacteria bacterium]|nr:hypothetical protein [Candidatus Paceibacterota bacterium]